MPLVLSRTSGVSEETSGFHRSVRSSATGLMAEWGKGDPRWIVEDRPDGMREAGFRCVSHAFNDYF